VLHAPFLPVKTMEGLVSVPQWHCKSCAHWVFQSSTVSSPVFPCCRASLVEVCVSCLPGNANAKPVMVIRTMRQSAYSVFACETTELPREVIGFRRLLQKYKLQNIDILITTQGRANTFIKTHTRLNLNPPSQIFHHLALFQFVKSLSTPSAQSML
jgi:hypothetical protein